MALPKIDDDQGMRSRRRDDGGPEPMPQSFTLGHQAEEVAVRTGAWYDIARHFTPILEVALCLGPCRNWGIDQISIEERLALAEEIWDSVAEGGRTRAAHPDSAPGTGEAVAR